VTPSPRSVHSVLSDTNEDKYDKGKERKEEAKQASERRDNVYEEEDPFAYHADADSTHRVGEYGELNDDKVIGDIDIGDVEEGEGDGEKAGTTTPISEKDNFDVIRF
jgi:hypothetical protein